jgi:hypothetical protein
MTLTIQASGNPKPTVRFFRGTEELVAAEGQVELKESEDGQTFTATILSVQPNQQGEYTATVQNTGGMAKSKKCKVTVTSMSHFHHQSVDAFLVCDRISGNLTGAARLGGPREIRSCLRM